MGYTHYWEWRKAPDATRFTQWSQDVKVIIDSLFLFPELTEGSLEICGADGTGQPVTADRLVAFNGNIEEDEAAEGFIIGMDNPQPFVGFRPSYLPVDNIPVDGFCKTAREPYDLVVTAALIRLAEYFPKAVKIFSDGDEEDWEDGSQLCIKIFGTGEIPLFEDDEDDDDEDDDDEDEYP